MWILTSQVQPLIIVLYIIQTQPIMIIYVPILEPIFMQKNVLGGNTQLLIPDTNYKYNVDQNYMSNIDNISHITTNTNCCCVGEAIEQHLKQNPSPMVYVSLNLQRL